MGQLVPFPARRLRYDAAALDRLVAEVDRRRLLRLPAGDGRERRQPRTATVVPFRAADR